MTLKYWKGAHTKHRLLFHVVLMPKYRKRVLQGKVAVRVQGLFYDACKVNWWWIEEIKILSDHIHFMIQIQPTESIAEVIQRLKGGSSRLLRKEFPELEEFLWGDSFWSDGYFAETVGSTSYDNVKAYIKENAESMPQGHKKPRASARV
jgi:putative transposase